MYKIIRTSTVPLSLNIFCRGLLRELSSEYEVVALSSPHPELREIAEREGVRTVAVNMRRRISPLSDLAALVKLTMVLRREKPQMVHSITPKAGLLSMLAARIAGVPVRVHTFTGLLFPTAAGMRRKLLMAADKLICRCATNIIAEGEGVRNDLVNHGITDKKAEVLGFGSLRGIDTSFYDRTPEVADKAAEIRKSAGASPSTFVFIFAGRIVRDKGIDDLAEAFARLAERKPDIRLLLVGGEEPSDPLSEHTRRTISQSQLIIRTGWTDDVRPWYAAADALVFPSRREGFPNAVIEAGAMGLPSIVTDINGSREIIIHGRNGVIIPACDKESLFAAMADMADNPERAAAMGREARPLVARRYEQSFVRTKLKDFYREILK